MRPRGSATRTQKLKAAAQVRTVQLLAALVLFVQRGPRSGLEHFVVVARLGRDDLEDIPVLDDLVVLVEAEDVDAGVVVVAGPLLEAVQDDEVPLRLWLA
jgi:hypothetical protein